MSSEQAINWKENNSVLLCYRFRYTSIWRYVASHFTKVISIYSNIIACV